MMMAHFSVLGSLQHSLKNDERSCDLICVNIHLCKTLQRILRLYLLNLTV